MRPREHVLLLRSGRHLDAALASLNRRYPDCRVTVVVTSGGEEAAARAGVADDDVLVYRAAPTFAPWPFFRSGLLREARRRDVDRVAVLWTTPDGAGAGNVDRTALAIAPGGFDAVLPTGEVVARRGWRVGATQMMAGLTSACVLVALGVLLHAPARAAAALGGMRRALTRA